MRIGFPQTVAVDLTAEIDALRNTEVVIIRLLTLTSRPSPKRKQLSLETHQIFEK
jgi:hypothetical protein